MQNFHIKSILLGIGIGIVLTAFISIIYSAGNVQEMSRDEIIARAKQYGMVSSEELINDGGENEENVIETGGRSDKDTLEEGSIKTPEKPQVTPEPKQPEISSSPVGEEDNSGADDVDNVNEEVLISVKPGYTSEIVADRLVDAGLITNAESFINELARMKLEGSIQVGDFKVKRGSSLTAIARIVTMNG